jgi:hypothetical protein
MTEIERPICKATPDGRMDQENAAIYLGVSTQHLYNLRNKEDGPPCFKIGRKYYYHLRDLDRWILDKTPKGSAVHECTETTQE